MFFKKLALGIHFRRKVMTLNIIHKTAITDANTPTSLNRFSITQFIKSYISGNKKQNNEEIIPLIYYCWMLNSNPNRHSYRL
jgi:hypothetical protein